MNISSLPQELRPRERLFTHGSAALSNAELLAIILRTGTKEENALELSARLLKTHDLRRLSAVGVTSLRKLKGIGKAKACQIIACFELARRLAAFTKEKRWKINFAKDVVDKYILQTASFKREHFIGLYLNSRREVINEKVIFIGSIDSSIVHPREIFQPAITEGASAMILLHNHPSGDPEPSEEDIGVTEQLIAAGKIMGIELLDHIIIGDRDYYSFREKGNLF